MGHSGIEEGLTSFFVPFLPGGGERQDGFILIKVELHAELFLFIEHEGRFQHYPALFRNAGKNFSAIFTSSSSLKFSSAMRAVSSSLSTSSLGFACT